MFRLNKLTDYAIVLLTSLSADDQMAKSAAVIAESSGIPEPTAAKILKLLAKNNILESRRGAYGGYYLTAALEDISVLSVIEAMDGPVSITECTDTSETVCNSQSLCPLRGNWDRVNTAIRQALTAVTVADMLKLPEAWTAPLAAGGQRKD